MGEQWRQVLIYDEHGEILADLSNYWDLSEGSHRVKFSKAWREAGAPPINPGILDGLGAPADWTPVPPRAEPGRLARQALDAAIVSAPSVEWATKVEKLPARVPTVGRPMTRA